MKSDIHPKYYPKAKVSCACGNKFTIGSTKPEIQVEICYQCHPFYTGKQKFLGVAGKVEKFKTRQERAAAHPKSVKKSVKKLRVKKSKK